MFLSFPDRQSWLVLNLALGTSPHRILCTVAGKFIMVKIGVSKLEPTSMKEIEDKNLFGAQNNYVQHPLTKRAGEKWGTLLIDWSYIYVH